MNRQILAPKGMECVVGFGTSPLLTMMKRISGAMVSEVPKIIHMLLDGYCGLDLIPELLWSN